MIKLADLLDEGFFDMFRSKSPASQQQQQQKPQQAAPAANRPKSDFVVDGLPITVEGVSDDRKGYQVFKGSDPIGDLRATIKIQQGNDDTGVRKNKGIEYVYYAIGHRRDDIRDHVNRGAYFSVAARAEGDIEAIKAKLKKIGEDFYHKVLAKAGSAAKIDSDKAKNL